MPLPPYYFEVVILMGWLVWYDEWVRGPSGVFVSFTKGPGGFLYLPIITAKVPTLIPINGIILVDHRVFVLGGDQEVHDGATTFEVSLDPISTTDLFDTFTKTLCVGYDNVALTLNFFSGSRGTCGTLVVSPIKSLTGRPVKYFLHLVQSPFRILAFSESFPNMFLFLFEQLRIAAHCLGPVGEGVNDTKFGREVVVAIPL